jgi:hypothetical protein
MAQEYVIMPAEDYQAACDAVRAKTGGIEPIKSGDMASEIGRIAGDGELVEKEITENGVYAAINEGVPGYSRVAVVVPKDAVFTQLRATENGKVYLPEDADGFSSVFVNVPTTGVNIGTVWVTPSSNTTTVMFTDVPGEPKMFAVYAVNATSVNNTTVYATSIVYDGESVSGVTVTRAGSYSSYTANWKQSSDYTWEYSNGALTIASGSATTGGNFRSSCTYRLTYVV